MYHVTPSKDVYKYIKRLWCIETYLGCGQPICLSRPKQVELQDSASKYEVAAKTDLITWRQYMQEIREIRSDESKEKVTFIFV